MKTIKIIDLLNKIANKEELPKKIKVLSNNKNFNYEKALDDYIGENDDGLFNECILETTSLEKYLNEEVEIIEEEKEIKKLDVAILGQCDNWLRCPTNEVTKQDIELNPYIINNIRENTLYFQRKINELIDAVNELKRGN